MVRVRLPASALGSGILRVVLWFLRTDLKVFPDYSGARFFFKKRLGMPSGLFREGGMNTAKVSREAFENRLFVEPATWTPPFQAWKKRAQITRELAEAAKDGQAKNLLLKIAETYERLAHP